MKFLKLLFVFVLLVLSANLNAQNQNFLERPYLETTATYTTEVIPDNLFLEITINEKDTRDKLSIEALENRMITTLKSLGIDTDKKLSVVDISSNFKKYFLKKTDVLKTKHYVLCVHDAKTLGQVAYHLEQANISNINIQKTEYSKLETLKIELREKAILKAKRQAESMLKPLNQKLGKALFISDTDTSINQLLRRQSSGLNTMYISSDKNITFADIGIEGIRVEMSVIVYFEIL